MKRGWIAAVMIGVALLLSGIEYLYFTSNTSVYIQMLNEADSDMEQNLVEDALSIVERLDYRYQKQSKIFNIFMYHSDVSAVSADLSMLRRYAQLGDPGGFLTTAARAKREIASIHNARLLTWDNIL